MVGTQAEVGAIVCWTDPDSYGHVAYMTAVNASGQIQVLESNYGLIMIVAGLIQQRVILLELSAISIQKGINKIE